MPVGELRGLAREFDTENPDRGKRNLNRWLTGSHLPSPGNRDRLAGLLGVDVSELPLPDDGAVAEGPLTREELREFQRMAARVLRVAEAALSQGIGVAA